MSLQSSQINRAMCSKKLFVFIIVLLMPTAMYAAGRYSNAGEAFVAGVMQVLFLYAIYAIYKFFKKDKKE